MENAPKAGPKYKIRFGAINATIWENKFNYKGKDIVNYSVNLSRSYKDKDGNWKETGSLKTNDLPKAIKALDEAYLWLLKGGKEEETTQEGQAYL